MKNMQKKCHFCGFQGLNSNTSKKRYQNMTPQITKNTKTHKTKRQMAKSRAVAAMSESGNFTCKQVVEKHVKKGVQKGSKSDTPNMSKMNTFTWRRDRKDDKSQFSL